MTEVLTHYPAGADVPDWLIAVEPTAPGAVFESLKFTHPAIVADLADRFLIFSPDMAAPPPVLHIVGGHNRIYAAAKPVYMVQAVAGFCTLDVDAWTPVAEMVKQDPPHPWSQPMPAPLNEREVIEQHQAQQALELNRQQARDAQLEKLGQSIDAFALQQARPGLLARLWAAFKG